MSAVIPFEATSSTCCRMLAPGAVRGPLWGRDAVRVVSAVRACAARRRAGALAGEPAERVGLAAVCERLADVRRADASRGAEVLRLRGVGRCAPDDPLTGMLDSLRSTLFHTTRIEAWCACVWVRHAAERADGGGGNGA